MASRVFASRERYFGHITLRFIHLPILILLLSVTLSERFSAAQTTELITIDDVTSMEDTVETEPNTTVNDSSDVVEAETTPDLISEIRTETATDEVVTVRSITVQDIDDITEGTTPDLATELITIDDVTSMEDTVETEPNTIVNDSSDVVEAETTPDLISEIRTETATDEVVTVRSITVQDIDGVTEGTTLDLATVLNIRFAISNRNYSQIEGSTEKTELEKMLISEFRILLNSTRFKSALIVLEFRNGSIIVDMKLQFTDVLNVRERDDVVTTIFEKVELNGTLGALQVQDLQVVNDDALFRDVNDACDIRPCLQPDMECVPKGTKCTAGCEDNKDYCLNDSICLPNNDYIHCKCKKDFFGYRCDKKPKRLGSMRNENAYIGIVAAAAVAVILLLVMIVGCGYNRLINKGKESDTSKLFPVENSVALEMLDEPPTVVGGVACQTIESFLLTKYIKHGVPPKPGFQHETIQTNDSFLLTKAEQQREAFNNDALTNNALDGSSTMILSSPIPALTTSNEQVDKMCQEDRSSSVPQKCTLAQETTGGQGISNEAFMEDEVDIVPTSEVVGEDAKWDTGKNIVKV